MKYLTLYFLIALFIRSSALISCPTCVARVQPNSPPFFVDEFYIPTDELFETDVIITTS